MEEPKTKCSEAGFAHSWENVTPNIVYPTNPPQYPPTQYSCRNCFLKKTKHEKTETWYEYSLPKETITNKEE